MLRPAESACKLWQAQTPARGRILTRAWWPPQRRSDLTLLEDSVVLVEYAEQQPLLQARPGMGLRLATFYRRAGAGDAGLKALQSSGALEGVHSLCQGNACAGLPATARATRAREGLPLLEHLLFSARPPFAPRLPLAGCQPGRLSPGRP